MKIRFYNAKILTMDREMFEGELWVEKDKICYVGEGKETDTAFDRQINCNGNLLMPGFKNAHTHSAMTFLRSFADDLPLQEWLYNRVFPMEAKLSKEDQIPLAKLAMLEYLTSGITANFDMYLHNPSHAKASAEIGFRTVLCGSINDFGGTVEEIEEEYLTYNEYHPLISARIGFHAEYTTKRETLETLVKLCEKHKAPIYTHLSETEKEVAECKERYGMTTLEFLASLGMFEYGGGGFHGVWLSEKEMEICREKNISIVSNPSSNVKLASGVADLCGLLKAGVNVGLGTDGPASNNALDMFREMYLAATLQKLTKRDAAAMDADAVLNMATAGGAKAMGLMDCDVLAAGKQADIIMIDMKRPNMQPVHNITKNLVYSGSKENVKMTMIAGKILYENGEFFIGQDVNEIYERVTEIVKRVTKE